jgi:hypothetical protein
MRIEQIMSLSGGRVQTQSGLHDMAGNAAVAPGQTVLVFDGHVIGLQRPQNKRPVWVSPPEVETGIKYYHFADSSALKMYYVDKSFLAIVRMADITPPDSSAKLILHCYNEDHEYLVWMWEPASTGAKCRCLIQKDGATLADFTSVFPVMPGQNVFPAVSRYSDAYIDDDGNLLWVAGCAAYIDSVDTFVLAKYSNGDLNASKMYTPTNCIELAKTHMENQITATLNATVLTMVNEESTTSTVTGAKARGGYYGEVYELEYTGSGILDNYKSSGASYYSEYVFDLWGLDVYIKINGSAAGAYGYILDITSRDSWTGSAETSQIKIPCPVISENANLVYSAKNESLVAEYTALGNSSDTWAQTGTNPKSIVVTTEYTEDGIIQGTVTGTPTTISFDVLLYIPSGVNFTDATHCTVKITSGANQGESRVVRGCNVTNSVITGINFSTAWDYIPESGTTFNIEVAIGTGTTVEQITQYTGTCTQLPVITNNASPSAVDLGNDYSAQTGISEINATTQNVYPVPRIKYSGDTIYELNQSGNTNYATDGAWLSASKKLTGLLPGDIAVLKADGSAVTTSDFSLFSNIVTKRFT